MLGITLETIHEDVLVLKAQVAAQADRIAALEAAPAAGAPADTTLVPILLDTSAHGGRKLADVEKFIADATTPDAQGKTLLTATQLAAAGIQTGGMFWFDDDALEAATGAVRDVIEANISKATVGIQQSPDTFIVAGSYVMATDGPNKGRYQGPVDEWSDHRVFPRGMRDDRILAVIKQRILDNGDADPNDPRFVSG
jgi:hypothetical protein